MDGLMAAGWAPPAPAAPAAPPAPLIKPVAPSNFSGSVKEDVEQWAYKANNWLTAGCVLDEADKISMVTGLFTGAALTWWRTRQGQPGAPDTWNLLAGELILQFQPIKSVESARDRLAACRQLGNVASYAAIFRSIALSIPDMADGDKKHRFISGLKPRTQQEVKLRDPPTFEDVVRAAVRFDSLLKPASNRWQHDSYGSGDAVPMELGSIAELNSMQNGRHAGHPNGQRGLAKGPKMTPKQRQQLRQAGKCFNCKEKGHFWRDCPKRA